MKNFDQRLNGARLVAALFLCLGFSALALPVVRIMPVGDSITDGTSVTNSLGAGGPGGGYRLPLWQALTNAGYNVDYLGLLTVNPSAVGMPTKHEGHSGWKIDQIYSNMVNAVFGAVEDPDVLLIMIGTNDFGQNYDENNATNRLSQLIGLVTTKWPYCKVIVASLTARGGADGLAIQTNFNNSVPGIVSNFQAAGSQVYFTDMHPVVPLGPEFMPDNLHPNTGGYLKMATNWFPAITNVISPEGTTNAPVIVRISPVLGQTSFVVTFSKPVDDATATNVGNYLLFEGPSVVGAVLEPVNKRSVTLTTTPLGLHTNYPLVVQGVADRTAAATVMDTVGTNIQTFGASIRGAFNNVQEAGDYRLVYSLNIPNTPNYTAGITYDTDLRAVASNFTRVAYYLELQTAAGALDYVWASFDAMTTNVNRIGVPTGPSGATFQQIVTNMTVQSSAAGIVNGTNIATGNIEFWPGNYSQANALGIPNANASTFDWGDTLSAGTGHGSMQVHNHGASQVLFAFNRWNAGSGADLGIGNGPTNVDWTFMANSAGYTVKVLQVYALLASNVPPVVASSYGSGYSNAVINFSLPVADDATNTGNYVVSGGLTVLNAALDPLTKQTVTLKTSFQSPGIYTAVVNNVHDRSSSNSLVIATNTIANFLGPAQNGVLNNVQEATNYTLVYSLRIPNGGAFNSTGVPYDVAVPGYVGEFTRVAYYLELQTATGLPSFVWVSMDPFTTNAARLGVPATSGSPIFQQNVTNMTVLSSVASIVQGSAIATGNMEFWPWNYDQNNTNSVPGASNTAYDWGDHVTSNSGGHGSMQIHNYGASQVLFAFNNWGAAAGGTTAVGIGNRPGSLDVDWTQAGNAAGYTVKTLQVFALPVSNVAPALAGASSPALTNVILVFSKMLDGTSIAATNFTIAGATVLGATLDPGSLARVSLTTTPLLPYTTYTATVSNVRDRTVAALMVAPNSTAAFRTIAGNGALGNVAEAADYQLVYSISLPVAASYPYAAFYDVDLRSQITNFTRVAYYLELQTNNGPATFAWTSFDAVTNNVHAIGIPTIASGATFQQPLTNMNVLCNAGGVIEGTGLGGGNIEFWPSNYDKSNAVAVANASSGNFDWGDIRTAGNYGSMQIHNHDANLGTSTGQVIFSFSKWGGSGAATADDLGIGNRPGSTDSDWTFANNAASYTSRILQVYALSTTNLPPVVLDVSGQPGLTNIVIQFSKTLTEGAAAVTNFSIAGLTVIGASLDGSTKTRVTLTTSPQTASTFYSLVIAGGIQDRTSGSLPLSGGPSYSFMSAPRNGVYNNVAEAAGYTLVYSLVISNTGNWSASAPPYSIDNRIGVTNYSRIGYYLELQKAGGAPQFVWATADVFAQDAGKIGVPVNASGALFQQPLTNLSVLSSVFGVVNGTNMGGGNIEFWPNLYTTTNNAGVPTASGTTFDWGDQPTAGNYGSMQIHNGGAGQVVFAFNNWGTANTLDLGIGNNLSNPNSDWTAMNNAGTYTSRILQVYVKQTTDLTPPTIVSASASLDRNRVLVTFSEPIADASVVAGNFSINNGVIVSAAALSNNLRQVMLTVSQLVGATNLLTVNNVRDRSPNANLIAPNSTMLITAPPLPSQITANVPEAAGYQLLYYLDIPANSPGWNTTGTTYTIDNRNTVGPFSRVAYFVELATNAGPTNWVYVSIDAFTTDVNKLGVPDLPSGALFQQKLTNMNVYSSQTNITTGTGFADGNIEFWPQNYAQANAANVTNASASTYDWGDQVSTIFGTGGHGSMQIHNAGASNVLFAYNAWGSARTSEMGIGNYPGNVTNTDWTLTGNAGTYSMRHIYVLVQPTSSTNGPVPVRALGYQGRTNVLVTFNEIMSDASANPANFGIDGGSLAVTAAALQPNLHDILLTTAPQTPGSNYVITVSNVTDRTTNGYAIASGASVNFTALPSLGVFANVPEATNYTLVYGLGLPGTVPNYGANNVPYGIDQRPLITQSFSRVAYYMELATNNGPTNWVYISDDPFTTNIRLIGVPVWNLGVNYQQKLATNANIFSSDTNIITGTGIGTCNIEFYPWNYGAATNTVIPNGSTNLYDWNDTFNNGGQYGGMQIHNYGALVGGGISTGQVLFAFNKWGSGQSGSTDIGIGSQPTNHPDWTSSSSGPSYTTKNLYVLVRLTNAPVVPPPTNSVIAPVFVVHPASLTNTVGATNTLVGLAVGTSPSYQWRFNGTPIGGSTNSWLTLANLSTNNAGSYSLLASNTAGVATSLVAVLSVTNPPALPPSGYDAWAAQITNGQTNYNQSALGDGYPNLLKYATGSNPTNSDNLASMNASRIGSLLALLFNHDTNAIDVTLIVEGANAIDNLALWNGIATNLNGSWGGATNVVENPGNPATVTVLDTAPSGTNRFLRLRVTRP